MKSNLLTNLSLYELKFFPLNATIKIGDKQFLTSNGHAFNTLLHCANLQSKSSVPESKNTHTFAPIFHLLTDLFLFGGDLSFVEDERQLSKTSTLHVFIIL